MASMQQMLVVAPPSGFSPPQDVLVETVYQVFGQRRRTRLRTAISLLKAAYPIARLADFSTSSRIDENIDLLTELLRRLYATDPRSILPQIRIYHSQDTELSELTSLDGHFIEAVVYAAHPCDSRYFIPVSEFHPYLLQQKRAEFVNLAVSLGAKEIQLTDTKQNSQNVNVSASMSDGVGLAEGKAAGEIKRQSATNFNLSASFSHAPAYAPQIPASLKWYHREPVWQAMANARIEGSAEEFHVHFTYRSDFGINLNLAAKVHSIGLEIGGSFNSMENIDQEYLVRFFRKTG